MNHFNHSPIACAKLKSIQQQLSTEPHKMKQDVPTRWNSSFEMLQRTFEQKVRLATYAAEFDEIKLPANYQWGIVEKLVYILAPFENLTKKMWYEGRNLRNNYTICSCIKSFITKSFIK